MNRKLMLTSNVVKLLLPLLFGCLAGITSAESLPGSDLSKTNQHDAEKQNKFNFEEHQTAESAEAVLRTMFPDGSEAEKFVAALTQAGARCMKEPLGKSLAPEQLASLERSDPNFLLNSKTIECRYSKFVAASVAAEWIVLAAEYPGGRIKGLNVFRQIVGP